MLSIDNLPPPGLLVGPGATEQCAESRNPWRKLRGSLATLHSPGLLDVRSQVLSPWSRLGVSSLLSNDSLGHDFIFLFLQSVAGVMLDPRVFSSHQIGKDPNRVV
jgi:hypothetical protein